MALSTEPFGPDAPPRSCLSLVVGGGGGLPRPPPPPGPQQWNTPVPVQRSHDMTIAGAVVGLWRFRDRKPPLDGAQWN